MKAPSSSKTKLKIIVGYLLLLILLFTTLSFIYSKVGVLTRTEDQISLKTDSLTYLIKQKDSHLFELLESIAELNTSLAVDSIDLKDLLTSAPQEVSPIIQRSVVKTSDTLLIKPKKRRFFKRLAAAFSPSKVDSTVQITTSVETSIDTLHSETKEVINEAVLEEIEARIIADKKSYQERVSKTEEFQRVNELISVRIDSLLTHYEKEQISQIVSRIEESSKSREDALFWISSVAIISLLLAVLFSFLLIRDLNRRIRFRREIERANARSEALLNAREKLILTITHDIKAPLGTVLGYLNLLKGSDLNTQEKEYVEHMLAASNHAYRLVYDLLDYHLLDLNKADIRLSSFNLGDFVNESYAAFVPLFDKKEIEFKLNMDDFLLNLWIKTDQVRLKQITDNLLSNALKFTDKGAVLLTVSFINQKLKIEVKDSGRGMTQQELQNIFKEFTRVASAQGDEGFGLGLSIVKKLIERLNGVVEVTSELGAGSLFKVCLPVAKGDSSGDDAPLKLYENLSIALMDDDKLQLNLIVAMFEPYGCTIYPCTHLEELIKVLNEVEIDLLVTDLQMPEITGFDLVELIQNRPASRYVKPPVLAVSARDQIDEKQISDAGFIGLLKKPFTAAEVLAKYQEQVGLITIGSPSNSVKSCNTAVFTVSNLEDFVGKDSGAVKSLLETFVVESQNDLLKLKRAASNEAIVEVGEVAHKLYPMVKLIGNTDLSRTLTSLDKQRNSTDYHSIKIEVEFVIKELDKLINATIDYLNDSF